MEYKVVPVDHIDPDHRSIWIDADKIDETGKVQWAFSDGPADRRLSSILFDTVVEGMAHYAGCVFYLEKH